MATNQEPCVQIGLKEIYDKVLSIDKKLDLAESNRRHIKVIYALLSSGGAVLGFTISLILKYLIK